MPNGLTSEQIANTPEVTLSGVYGAPEPLRRDIPPAAPYPIHALGNELAPMVRRLMAVVQAPPALCAQSVLAAAALAAQGHANASIDGRLYPLSLYFITVGESGERKTTVDGYALKPHQQRERNLYEQYSSELEVYHQETEVYKQARKEALKNASGFEEMLAAVTALGPQPLEPLQPILTTEDPTFEGLVKLLRDGQPSIGLFAHEAGQFIGGSGMNKDNKLKTAGGLSSLWDCRRTTRVRSGEPFSMFYARRLSMHLLAQPSVAQLVIQERLFEDQGLLARCLLAWPATTAGTRLYQAIDLSVDPDVQQYNTALAALLDRPFPLKEGTRNELDPPILQLTPEAKQLWTHFHDHIEQQLGPDGALASVRGFGSKVAEHAVRIAGVLTVVDDPDAGEIDTDYMAAGIELAGFYLGEARRLCETTSIPPDILLAEKLLGWLQQQGLETVYLSQIYQLGPNSIREAKTARKIVGVLEEHGWLIPIEGGMELDGKHRREVWRVCSESASES